MRITVVTVLITVIHRSWPTEAACKLAAVGDFGEKPGCPPPLQGVCSSLAGQGCKGGGLGLSPPFFLSGLGFGKFAAGGSQWQGAGRGRPAASAPPQALGHRVMGEEALQASLGFIPSISFFFPPSLSNIDLSCH